MRQRKYTYIRVLQELQEDDSWADCEFADKNDKEDMAALRHTAGDYRREGIIVRFVDRRIPNDGRILNLNTI